jgi:hypothetical protein
VAPTTEDDSDDSARPNPKKPVVLPKVGAYVQFSIVNKKKVGGLIRKIEDGYFFITTSLGEKVKVLTTVHMEVLDETGPFMLWNKGAEQKTIFKRAKDAPVPLDVKLVTEDSMQLIALLMSVEGFCSPSAETRDQPAPKWVQQLAKGQSFFTPTLGDNYPKALDLVATYRAMEASTELVLNKIIIQLGYVVSFDPRNGQANLKGLKMVGVCVRAIKKYKSKPARVGLVDPSSDGEWIPGEGNPSPPYSLL